MKKSGGGAKLNKRIASIVIATGLITTMSTLVFAEPLNDTLKQQQKTVQQKQDSLKGVQGKMQQLEKDIEGLDIQIEGLMRKIADNNSKINKTQNDIKVVENDLAKLEAELKKEQDFFDQRMKAMYVSGNEGYLEILLDSDGVSDFFQKLEGVKKVAELNKKVVSELDDKKTEITVKKKSLNDENVKLLAFKADNEKKLVVLNENKASQNKLVAQYKAQEKLDSAELNKSKALVDETRKKIEEMAKHQQATISTPSRGGAVGPISTDALILYAYSFRGIPYLYGGNGLDMIVLALFKRYILILAYTYLELHMNK